MLLTLAAVYTFTFHLLEVRTFDANICHVTYDGRNKVSTVECSSDTLATPVHFVIRANAWGLATNKSESDCILNVTLSEPASDTAKLSLSPATTGRRIECYIHQANAKSFSISYYRT